MTTETLPSNYPLRAYVIRSVLGKGGFGITYLALDTMLKSLVAIKEYFPADYANRAEDMSVRPKSELAGSRFDWGRERFLLEAQLLAQFKHPNIVRVLSLFEENNTAYMIMDFEQGQSLAAMLKQTPTQEMAFIDRILPPLLDGLEKLHAAGFIHRDIKPDNIYIRADGSPVLLDFGSARNAMGAKPQAMTALLTPGYSPLEQYYSTSDDQGPWSDIYALGGVLYRLIFGESPPEAVLRSSSALSGRSDPLIPAAVVGKGRYRLSFLEAIDQALRVIEKERPQSIAQWREMLYPGISVKPVTRAAHPKPTGTATQSTNRSSGTATPPSQPSGVVEESELLTCDVGPIVDLADTADLDLLYLTGQANLAGREQQFFRRALVLTDVDTHARMDQATLQGLTGATVETRSSGKDGLAFLQQSPVDLIICDTHLTDMSGRRFLHQMSAWTQFPPVLMVTYENRRSRILDAISLGVAGYLLRPYTPELFQLHLRQLLDSVSFYNEERLLLGRGADRLAKGDPSAAMKAFTEAAGLVEDPLEYYDEGCRELMGMQYGKAMTAFRRMGRISLIHIEALSGLSRACVVADDGKAAKEYALEAAEKRAAFNRLERNRRMFIDVIKRQDDLPNPFNTLGVKLRRKGDYAGAIRAYAQALELTPDDPRVLHNLARVYASTFDHQQALELVSRSLDLDPGFAQSLSLYKLLTGKNWQPTPGNESRPALPRSETLTDD